MMTVADRTLVKICGLTSTGEAEVLRRCGADMAGMVLFFEKSKRCIGLDRAAEIMAKLGDIKKVAVTVSPTAEQLRAISAAGFDYVQIHGAVEEEALAAAEIPVIKAFNVTDIDTLPEWQARENVAGYVFDAAEYGSGKVFDWRLLEAVPRDGRLFILAGGLTPDNVRNAIDAVRPDAVDVSSGVEYKDRPGKDPQLIERFIAAAARCQRT